MESILTTKQRVSCRYHGHWVSTAHSCPEREGPAKKEESGQEHVLLDSAPCWLSLTLNTGATHPLLPSFLPSFISD